MIIVEGPDGSGKTTLVNELFYIFKEQFPLAIAHSPGPRPHVVEHTFEAFAYEVKGGNRPVIHDRLFFSELVYGKILRGEVAFNQYQKRFLTLMLRWLDI